MVSVDTGAGMEGERGHFEKKFSETVVDHHFIHPLRFLKTVIILTNITHKQTKEECVLLIKVLLTNIFGND